MNLMPLRTVNFHSVSYLALNEFRLSFSSISEKKCLCLQCELRLEESSISKHQTLSMQMQTLTNKHIRNSDLRMF